MEKDAIAFAIRDKVQFGLAPDIGVGKNILVELRIGASKEAIGKSRCDQIVLDNVEKDTALCSRQCLVCRLVHPEAEIEHLFTLTQGRLRLDILPGKAGSWVVRQVGG